MPRIGCRRCRVEELEQLVEVAEVKVSADYRTRRRSRYSTAARIWQASHAVASGQPMEVRPCTNRVRPKSGLDKGEAGRRLTWMRLKVSAGPPLVATSHEDAGAGWNLYRPAGPEVGGKIRFVTSSTTDSPAIVDHLVTVYRGGDTVDEQTGGGGQQRRARLSTHGLVRDPVGADTGARRRIAWHARPGAVSISPARRSSALHAFLRRQRRRSARPSHRRGGVPRPRAVPR